MSTRIKLANSHNKLLKFAAKNAAGQLLAGFAKNTRNCPLAERYVPASRGGRRSNLKVYWNDEGRGIESSEAYEADINQVLEILSEELHGVEGNFLGLIDGNDNTMQFYFCEGVPDEVEDAGHLEIVDVDFPCPEKGGSFVKRIKIDDISEYIKKAFKVGANYSNYDGSFIKW